MSNNKFQSPPAGYLEGNPPPGYPTQAPPTQYAEAAGPVKKKTRGEKGCIEGCLAALCCCFMCEECC